MLSARCAPPQQELSFDVIAALLRALPRPAGLGDSGRGRSPERLALHRPRPLARKTRATPDPKTRERALSRRSLLDEEIPDGHRVEARAVEATDGLVRRADDRLAAHVERGVQDDGYAGELAEVLDHGVEPRVRALRHGLRSHGSIDVHDRWNLRSALGAGLVGDDHERRRLRVLEIVALHFVEHRRTERPPRLPEL